MKYLDFLGNYDQFVTNLIKRTAESGIDLKDYPIDHLCYRTGTINDYEQVKEKLLHVSDKYLENQHHGRPISKFILSQPLQVDDYEIPLIELPAPSQSRQYKNGLEHLEFVVGDDYDEIRNMYKHLWSAIDDSGDFNQPLSIEFENIGTVKFHRLPLEEVVKLEGNEFVVITN